MLAGDFTIRLFNEDDLADVVGINQICLPENYSDSFFLDVFYQFPKTFLVAAVGDSIVGYIMCRTEIDFSEMRKLRLGRRGHVISLAVLPQYRGKGIARELLSEAMDNLSSYEVSECYLEVRVGNKVAIDLYTSLSFKVSRVVPGYYRDGEDAYVMVKAMS